MTSLQKSRLTERIKAPAVFIVFGFFYFIWLLITDIRIPCIFYETTGFLCPGCGTTRMTMALLRFDFSAAMSYNGAVLIALPFLTVSYILETYRYVKSGCTKYTVFSKITVSLSCAVIFIYNIIRNFF